MAMLEKIQSNIALIGFLIVLAGLGIGSGTVTPGHAIVYLDDGSRTFISPPCLQDGQYDLPLGVSGADDPAEAGLIIASYADAKSMKFRSDARCVNSGGLGEQMTLAEAIIFGHPLLAGPRWEEDGSWNW